MPKFQACRSPRQPPLKRTRVTLGANAFGPAAVRHGATLRPASSLRRVMWKWCIFPASANHLLHGQCQARLSLRRKKETGLGLLIGSEEDHFSLQREEAFTTVAGKPSRPNHSKRCLCLLNCRSSGAPWKKFSE